MILLENLIKLLTAGGKRDELYAVIEAAAADGRFTEREMQSIQDQCVVLGLSPDDLKEVRVRAYRAAATTISQDSEVTDEELSDLEEIQKFLQIPEGDVATTKRALYRLRLISEISQGNLPTLDLQGVVLRKQEQIHWIEAASLIEERVIRKTYVGGTQSVGFRVMKGVTFRVGGTRGHMIAERDMIPISFGDLIVTNQRVIFRGDKKSFQLLMSKLLEFEAYGDGLRLTDINGKPRALRIHEPSNTDIVAAVLSFCVNQIGPA